MEAILRRCDHSGDKELSYDEFCEVTEILILRSIEGDAEEDNAQIKEKSPAKNETAKSGKPDSRP